jgi:hypothetical protein
MSVQALILTHVTGDISAAKQVEACWDYITAAEHLTIGGVLRHGAGPAEAAAAVHAGTPVVVAAYRVPDLELTGEIESVGGHVEYVHSYSQGRLTVRKVLAALYRRVGWSASQIARTVGTDTEDVMDHLRRAGIPKPRRRE